MRLEPGARDGVVAWSTRRSRWVHIAVIATAPAITTLGISGGPPVGPAVVAVPLALAILALQLRHSFAFARGERPHGAMWTLLALAVLVYLPIRWWNWSWLTTEACLMASAIMLLPRRLAAAIVAAIVAGTDLAVVRTLSGQPVGTLIYWICYETATYLLLCAALYGSTRLVRLVDELQATRAELAELAIGRERLRVSRDCTTCWARACPRSRSRATSRSGCCAATRWRPGRRSRA